MKKLLAIIVLSLCFITTSHADDIGDFQIEGISIGDSALNYFSEEEIKKNIRKNSYVNSDGKFYDANLNNFKFFKTYKNIQVNFKKNDIILLGRESEGVPEKIHKEVKFRLKIPINKKTRSLNVATTAAMVVSIALKNIKSLK